MSWFKKWREDRAVARLNRLAKRAADRAARVSEFKKAYRALYLDPEGKLLGHLTRSGKHIVTHFPMDDSEGSIVGRTGKEILGEALREANGLFPMDSGKLLPAHRVHTVTIIELPEGA